MTMPIDLVLVRHGQSEHNLAAHMARNGDESLYTNELRTRHDSQHRLTPKGRRQAVQAGDWMRTHDYPLFDRKYVSSYTRAMETAGLLKLDGPDWMIDPLLREREWGELDNMTPEERTRLAEASLRVRDTDPFYWVPPNGESIAQVTIRLRSVLDTLHRECSEKKVVIVCHGEVMAAFRFILERMTIESWTEFKSSTKPGDKIYNCQILHYTRKDPESGDLAPHLDWLNSISPTDETNSSNGWMKIVRHRYTGEQLLQSAESVAPLFPDHEGY